MTEKNERSEVAEKAATKKGEVGGRSTRMFSVCPNCGARLFGKSSGMPVIIAITAGSLDDPSRFKPAIDFYTSSAQPWDHMNPQLPKFPKQPKV